MSEEHSGFLCQDPWEMELDASLATDHTWCGIVKTLTAGENFTFGQLGYYKSDEKVWGTDADVVATTEGILVIALGTINADNTGKWLLWGDIRDDTYDFAAAGELIVSEAKFAMTQTKPSGSGDTVRKCGHAWTADIIHFDPSPYEYPEYPA